MCAAGPISGRKVDAMRRSRKRKSGPLSKSEQMARVHGADTGPEMALRRALWQAGLRYRVRPGIPGRPDLAFIRCRIRSEEHTSELQSRENLVCRLLLDKKKC